MMKDQSQVIKQGASIETKMTGPRWRALLVGSALVCLALLPAVKAMDPAPGRLVDQARTPAEGSRTISRIINGQKTILRVYDDANTSQVVSSPDGQNMASARAPSDSICSLELRAKHGQIAPNTGGGVLNPIAFANPTTINSSGRIAFNSRVAGSSRNQGVFVANSDGSLNAIAIGCGGFGGSGDTTSLCGDSSPIGGHFSGFFDGTGFTPDSNDAGDVIFFSEVNGGSSRRGLFFYHAATQQIEKVAVIGDPSPIGGIFGAVGPGSLNNSGKVVFLASPVGTTNSNIFMWNNGVVTKVAAIGDPAPGGGTFSLLGTEAIGFHDGTFIPTAPVPDINDSGQISFRAIVTGGITERGLIVRSRGLDQWYVKVPDPTPIGGTYLSMEAATLNNAGQIAFFSDFRAASGEINSGWFAGSPGNWRKVIVFSDPLDGGVVSGLALSRNPMQSIDAAGNVVFSANLSTGEGRLVLSLADGDLLIAARQGDSAPGGGTIGVMDGWPSVNGGSGTLNAATPGEPLGALSAHMVFNRCSSLELTSASSRVGRVGSFEINLPLEGTTGIECRRSRLYTTTFTFNNAISSVDQSTTTCGTVGAVAVDANDPHRVLVTLQNVSCNEEKVTVGLAGVHDDQGNILGSAAATMGLLIGDVDADGVVTRTDVRQTRSAVGQKTNSGNFRKDVNTSGHIDVSDVRLVRSKVGTMLSPNQR